MIKIQKEIKREKEKEVLDVGSNLDKFETKYYTWLTTITILILVSIYFVLVFIPLELMYLRGLISKGFTLYLVILNLILFGIISLLLIDYRCPFYEYFIKKNPLAYQENLEWHIKYYEREKNSYKAKYLKLIENKREVD